MTAGPSAAAEDPSPLDHMTDEEKEREADKLADLFDRLERYVVSLSSVVEGGH